MKALVSKKYGSPDVLRYQEVPIPVCGPGEVLIRVHAVSLNAADWRMLRAAPWLVRLNGGVLRPRNTILGSDVAGTIAAVSPGVPWKVGDEVFGNLFETGNGGLAEFARAAAGSLVAKPKNLTFEEASAVPMAAVTALQGLRDLGQVGPGQSLLIHGAMGGVGQFAVQLAVQRGARVTAVCGPRGVETVRGLGASKVLDYTRQDFVQDGGSYDVILGINGSRRLEEYLGALRPDGRYVMVGGDNRQIFDALIRGPWLSRKGGRTVATLTLNKKTKASDLGSVKDLFEQKRLRVVVDRCYSLEDGAEAFRYIEQGHAQGKVVVTIPAAV